MENVDLAAGTLRFSQALKRNAGASFAPLKTGKSARLLYMAPVTATALKQHRTRQLGERLLAGSEWIDHGLVFTNRFGGPVSQRTITRHFQAHLRRLGLREQRFHDARHACASYLLSQGVPLNLVSAVLGHAGLSITADVYGHIAPDAFREAMGHMDRAFAAL